MNASFRTLAAAAVALLVAAPASAQEPLPAVLPTVVFLIEDSARMGQDWDGDSTLTTPDSRWSYVRDAIIHVVQNAPVGMDFGVALTKDGDTFEPLAYPGMSTGNIVAALNAHTTSSDGARTMAESYAALLRDWASLTYGTPASWAVGPFQYDCSELIVVAIGSNVGELDSDPALTATPASDVLCNDSAGFQGCFADDVAHYAYNNFSAPISGSGAVRTHGIFVDASSPSASADAAPLFQAIANAGEGLYYGASVPGGIATSIWGVLTDSFSGSYSNAQVSMTPAGDKLFASFFDVEAGHPLYKGHLLMWNIEDDPTEANFGQIIPGTGIAGSAWDAGQLLASRTAYTGEDNPSTFNQDDPRVGFTAPPAEAFMTVPLAFDGTEVTSDTDELTDLLIEPLDLASNPLCDAEGDYNFDCIVNFEDAQVLVDFIRGVNDTPFLHTGLARGPWKMGDTGHSNAVAAPSDIGIIATEDHFVAFRTKLQELPGAVYVASNSGMLHSFYLEGDLSNDLGSELWFYVPRAKADKDPAAAMEFDGHQIDDLMRSGQTYVNDGKLALDYVWLDGYSNGLTDCGVIGYDNSLKDGGIDNAGCEWHRIVVWAGGYGARHVYALDITNPLDPYFLWERTDDAGGTSSEGVGRAVMQPSIGAFVDASVNPEQRRWLTVWTGGSQPPSASSTSPDNLWAQANIYVSDMNADTTESPTDYDVEGYKVEHPDLANEDADIFEEYTPPELGLFGSPALADLDSDGSIDVGYVGDSMGYVFKILFDPDDADDPTICTFASPDSGDESEHIFYRPAVFYSQSGELLVYYGSGSTFDLYDNVNGGVYVRGDPDPYGCQASVAAPCADDSPLFNSQGFYSFTGVGEKFVGNPIVAFGRMFFTTHIPGSDPCVLGNSRIYGLNVETCGGGIFDITTDSYNVQSDLYTEVDGLVSQPVFANNRVYALNIDGSGIDGDSVIDDFQVTPSGAGGMNTYTLASWRHVF